jgi:drug/metabolite transporter (DMT)-like permease
MSTSSAAGTGRGIALKLASIFLFTVMAALIKVGREVVPTGEAVFFRSFFALPPILIWAAVRGQLAEAFRVNDRFAHLNRGLVGVSAMACGFAALGFLPLPEVIAIGFAAPLMATALAAILLGERVRLFRWTAVLVGLAGVLVMIWPRLTVLRAGAVSDAEALGAWLALLGAALVALATVHIRKLTRTETTLSIVFWFTVISTLAALTTLPFGWVMATGWPLAALVASGLLGGTAQIMMTESYRRADASTLAPMDYTAMVYGLAIGYVVFAEIPGPWVLVGASIVISAGILIIWRERQLGLDNARARAAKTPQG